MLNQYWRILLIVDDALRPRFRIRVDFYHCLHLFRFEFVFFFSFLFLPHYPFSYKKNYCYYLSFFLIYLREYIFFASHFLDKRNYFVFWGFGHLYSLYLPYLLRPFFLLPNSHSYHFFYPTSKNLYLFLYLHLWHMLMLFL